MHAHVEWESQDCDGVLSGSYVMKMTDEETSSEWGEIEFQDRVVAYLVNVHALSGTLTVSQEDDTPVIEWSESTDEGGRCSRAVFWEDGDCPEPHKSTFRDHRAEVAGY